MKLLAIKNFTSSYDKKLVNSFKLLIKNFSKEIKANACKEQKHLVHPGHLRTVSSDLYTTLIGVSEVDCKNLLWAENRMSAEFIWMGFNRSCSTHGADKPKDGGKSISALPMRHFTSKVHLIFMMNSYWFFMAAFSPLRYQLSCAYVKCALSETQISQTCSATSGANAAKYLLPE